MKGRASSSLTRFATEMLTVCNTVPVDPVKTAAPIATPLRFFTRRNRGMG
jgi:hypothetical protein